MLFYVQRQKAPHVSAVHDNNGKVRRLKMGRAYIVLDTETADQYARKTDQPEPENSLVYDMGWTVVKDGNIIAERSFAISDTFNKRDMMNSAYYAAKLPQYYAGMRMDDSGAWKIATFLEAWQVLTQDIKANDVRKVWAYNARFDMLALRNTLETYSNGFVPGYRLLPYGVRFADIWDYASNITSTKKYVRWCLANGYTTEKGNPSTSAETVYRYLTTDTAFIEDHTALSDARIENAILTAAHRRKAKTRHSMGQGWRDAARTLKTL